MNNFITQRELSQVLGVSERTIQWWRQHGRFPQPDYIGRTPVYLRSVLDAWFAGQSVTVTNEGEKCEKE